MAGLPASKRRPKHRDVRHQRRPHGENIRPASHSHAGRDSPLPDNPPGDNGHRHAAQHDPDAQPHHALHDQHERLGRPGTHLCRCGRTRGARPLDGNSQGRAIILVQQPQEPPTPLRPHPTGRSRGHGHAHAHQQGTPRLPEDTVGGRVHRDRGSGCNTVPADRPRRHRGQLHLLFRYPQTALLGEKEERRQTLASHRLAPPLRITDPAHSQPGGRGPHPPQPRAQDGPHPGLRSVSEAR